MFQNIPNEKLDESIHILNLLNSRISTNLNALFDLVNYKIHINTVLVLNQLTFEYGLIQIASYIDEYNKFFQVRLPEELKPLFSAIYKRIKQDIKTFSGLNDFRNNLLAHNLRVKGGKPVHNSINFKDYKVPKGLQEFMLLSRSIENLTAVINEIFPFSHNNAANQYEDFQNFKDRLHQAILTKSDVEAILLQQVSDLKQLLGN